MKKATLSILAGVLMLVTLCMFPFSANAAETVSVSIPVEIEGGGTAIVIPEVNCPIPKQSQFEVHNGSTENINIVFSGPGTFIYTIKTISKKKSYYTPELYTATIAVMTDKKGKLTATVVLTKAGSTHKHDVCLFAKADAPSDKSNESKPTDSTIPNRKSKNPPVSRPKTGDDNMLDIYLLICIAASAGLFMLSVIYYISTDRMIKSKQKDSIK